MAAAIILERGRKSSTYAGGQRAQGHRDEGKEEIRRQIFASNERDILRKNTAYTLEIRAAGNIFITGMAEWPEGNVWHDDDGRSRARTSATGGTFNVIDRAGVFRSVAMGLQPWAGKEPNFDSPVVRNCCADAALRGGDGYELSPEEAKNPT